MLVRSALVFIGAGFGGVSRYLLGGWITHIKSGVSFPWETFTINASGSLLIGLVVGLLTGTSAQVEWRLVVVVGFLGGYTTFSSFSLETLTLLQQRSYLQALGNVFGSCAIGLLAAWFGMILSKLIVRG